ncbi:MAG: PilZ domain-containing protein [Bdellovibrionales bacterium]|nr:PilZ domain-containing protein [Bdellovibrionales bacterium]
MAVQNNVIPFRNRKGKKDDSLEIKTLKADHEIIDITDRRQEIIRAERRRAKRTVLTQFVGAFIVLPKKGLQKVELYDIADKGVSFDIPFEVGKLDIGEEVAMRFYINQKTFFPFTIRITNCRDINEEGIFRQGSEFLRDPSNTDALNHFVKFIEAISLSLQEDSGDIVFGGRR